MLLASCSHATHTPLQAAFIDGCGNGSVGTITAHVADSSVEANCVWGIDFE
ncbi:MAG: hypothetical protein R8M45_00415 [Ghiorsea sp.]